MDGNDAQAIALHRRGLLRRTPKADIGIEDWESKVSRNVNPLDKVIGVTLTYDVV